PSPARALRCATASTTAPASRWSRCTRAATRAATASSLRSWSVCGRTLPPGRRRPPGRLSPPATGSVLARDSSMVPERRRSYRALVVEDDKAILGLVKHVLEREEFIVEGVERGADAIALLKLAAYDLLIVDLMLPDVSGEAILAYL